MEKDVKSFYDDYIQKCIRRQFNYESDYGYVIVLGGEALNHYFPTETSDYDVKFVIYPKGKIKTDLYDNFNKRYPEFLKTVNMIRLDIADDIYTCLKRLPQPTKTSFKDVKFKLTLIQKTKDESHYDEIMREEKRYKTASGKFKKKKGFKVFLPKRNFKTGELISGQKVQTIYKFNKNFAIRIEYKDDDNITHEFSIVDVGLKYDIPKGEKIYNFFGRKIFNTFLDEKFIKDIHQIKRQKYRILNTHKVPIPYIVDRGIRYPKLEYLLYETFVLRLIFIHQSSFTTDQECIDKNKDKIRKYSLRLEHMYQYFRDNGYNNIIDKIKDSIENTTHKFEIIKDYIVYCYSTNGKGVIFKKTSNIFEECDDPNFLNWLMQFRTQYDYTLYLISVMNRGPNDIYDNKNYIRIFFEYQNKNKYTLDRIDICGNFAAQQLKIGKHVLFQKLRDMIE